MKEQVTLSPIAIKRAIQFAEDSGISEVFTYEHESGKNYVTNPAVSVSLDDDSLPVHHTLQGVYIRLTTLRTLFINVQQSGKSVELTQNGNSIRLRYV